MDKKKYQIFISSTYTDLIDVRKKVQETILSMYHFPIGMEMFSAGDDEQWEVIKDTIDSSDYYVVIIGHRYGSETCEGISYTEKEYDYAKEKGIPILAFIRKRDIAIREHERESQPEKVKKLDNFIKKVSSNKMCDYWETDDELASAVTIALYKQFNSKPRPGWIRADNIDFTEISNELMKQSQENRRLREENENLKSKLVVKKPMINLNINDTKEISLEYSKEYDNIKHQFKALSYEEVPEELKDYVTEEDIKDYNNSLPSSEEINRYIQEKIEYERIKNSGKDINIKVSNDGTLKANNIYIDIEFPEDIRVIEVDEIENLKEPKELKMPINPIKRAEKECLKRYMTTPSIMKSLLKDYNGLNVNVTPVKLSSLYNKRHSLLDNNIITIKLNSLMHTRQIYLDEKYRIIPFKIGNFEIKVSIICEEYEEKIEYNIPVLVKEI